MKTFKSLLLYNLSKRLFDFLFAFFFLILLAPIFLILSLLIVLKMGWPAIFRQTRPGLNGKPFQLLKFRTMKLGGGSDAERMTRFGSKLRALSLDEIPQLFNVLKGDLSLVGPRPLLMQYLPRYSKRQNRRHLVKPGITGWAQIKGRNALSWEEKFEFDVWYVENRSFWLDLKIVFLTLFAVIQKKGVSQTGHVTMPEFMGSEGPPTLN